MHIFDLTVFTGVCPFLIDRARLDSRNFRFTLQSKTVVVLPVFLFYYLIDAVTRGTEKKCLRHFLLLSLKNPKTLDE